MHGVVGAAVDAQAGARPQQPHRLGARERRDVVDVLLALTAVADLLVAGHRIPRDLAGDRDLDEIQGVGTDSLRTGRERRMARVRRASPRRISAKASAGIARRARDGSRAAMHQVCDARRHCWRDRCSRPPAAPRRTARFPSRTRCCCPPTGPQQIVLSTNFGLIISDDGGATWQWTCERPETSMASTYAMGAPPAGIAVQPVARRSAWPSRMTMSCSWHRAGGALASAIATDDFPDPTDAAHVLAIVGGAGGAGAAPTPFTNRRTAATPSPPRRSTSRPRATQLTASRSRAAIRASST